MYAWSQLISVKKSTSCLDLQKSIWDHWLCIENISDIPLMDWINGLCQRVLTKDLMTLKLRVAFSEKLLVPLIDDVILGCWGLCILIEQGDTITHDCLNVEFVTKYLRWPHSILTNPCAVCTCHLIVQVCIQYMNVPEGTWGLCNVTSTSCACWADQDHLAWGGTYNQFENRSGDAD